MSTLCWMCRQIPASFFTEKSYKYLDRPRVPHWSIRDIRESANRGCPLCVILSGSIKAEPSPSPYERHQYTMLGRGIIDPHQDRRHEDLSKAEISSNNSFALYVGLDDISYGLFFKIPSPWCDRNLPQRSASQMDDTSLCKHWLTDCLYHHTACTEFASTHMPTRLLHLFAFEDDLDLQLVEMSDLASRQSRPLYATLSHCWGDSAENTPWKTKTSNVRQHHTRIKHKDLSRTFRDAVRICRDLAISYLWIDSLCILQDCEADWERESAKMANVYMSSLLNLAACSSKDGSGGCRRDFHNSELMSGSPYYDLETDGSKFRLFQDGPGSWDDIYEETPLTKRGWVVQERELAPRAIHYCKDTLLWECKTSKASSELPWFEMRMKDQEPDLLYNSPADTEPYDETLATPFYKSLDISPTSRSLGMRHYWFSMVEGYSHKLLSREIDRLPAIVGLAQASQDPLKGQYLAGIWENEMPSALLWRVTTSTRHQISHADANLTSIPSWSWAAVGCGITYDSQRSWNAHNSHATRELAQREITFEHFRVRGVQVHTRPIDRSSEISEAYLQCSGRLIPLNIGVTEKQTHRDDQFFTVHDNKCNTVGLLYPDVALDRLETSSILFCPVRDELRGYDGVPIPWAESSLLESTNYIRGNMCMGIGMVPIPSTNEQRLRRFGLLRFVRKEALLDIEPVEFKII